MRFWAQLAGPPPPATVGTLSCAQGGETAFAPHYRAETLLAVLVWLLIFISDFWPSPRRPNSLWVRHDEWPGRKPSVPCPRHRDSVSAQSIPSPLIHSCRGLPEDQPLHRRVTSGRCRPCGRLPRGATTDKPCLCRRKTCQRPELGHAPRNLADPIPSGRMGQLART